ncbi:putative disease resistance RPP13-like protein 1 isoform X1 [Chenopodium quinoa]|uniref:putative disease resistance RPP13-like protein 1 isoform X1 n=1 Tax=Chenopodium quinoa TaxID=63459 RepID=UPI000B790C16|nr:putative disease resistance RPP13-like protein 1 isoform X1 [Chenopodium quinoa]XP_021730907.1 putative disease resistance RPP13-like protein 1 isoform X1 [Chenopodium quinoa]
MAVGETILSAFLEVLFEQMLSSGGRQFLKLIGGVDLPKTIKKWKIQFTRLEALLDDAELQQFHSKPVKLWLNDLQDLAYDIEDLLDHFATEALGYQLKKAEEDEAYAVIDHSNAGILDRMAQTICVSGSRAADSLSTFLKPVDQRIQDKIDDITERLQDIQDQTQSLSLTAAHMMQQQTLQTETLRSQRESTSLVGQVFGRDDMKEEIITMLLKDDQNAVGYVVIPIVGTGGIGKTTLAQYVYNDEQMYVYRGEQLYAHNGEQQKSNFDSKAWVCVSDVFDVKRVTIDIINSATRSNDFNCSNLDQAQLKLQEVLKGKKFFIVLDDIWSEEYGDWDKLQEPFRHGAKGSRVILTTRTKSIAMMMVTNPTQRDIIKLERLSNVDSWLIFQQHANEDSDLAEMRDNIVEKINGLALAAKALGGLLKSIPDKSQRRKILESNIWAEKSSVLPVLRLSYHHMPSHLKRVFAYCSVFPKDYVFEETELVLLWMAQGFLPETQNERMEDMGHKYFNDLVSRSLFEKPPSSVKDDTFIMHDLIHDVAQLAAGDVCYIMDSKRDDLERVRHLFVNRHVHTLGDDLERVPQLRSFLCRNNYLRVDNLDTIQSMHYIRALYLASNIIKVVPEYIGDLKHLCYLILNFRNIQVLPHSINNLWNLQTLGLNFCLNLEKVPYIGSLEKLRHIYSPLRPTKDMPLGIGRLTNLQTLGEFVLAPGGGSRVRELGMLNHLRGSLCLLGLENVTEVADAEEAQLHKKEGLDELYMNWGTCVDEVGDMTKRDVIEKLQPHTSIKKCKLEGYMGTTLPSWLGDTSFSNMVDITLWECQKCECLPPLGQLPSLKGFWIQDMDGIKEVGLEFYGHCSNPFPSLKTIFLWCDILGEVGAPTS